MISGNINDTWSSMTHEQKKHQLFLKQKALLDQFLKTGAISKAQHDKSRSRIFYVAVIYR